MGEIVLAAKITHVPSMFISEQPGPHHGFATQRSTGIVRSHVAPGTLVPTPTSCSTRIGS